MGKTTCIVRIRLGGEYYATLHRTWRFSPRRRGDEMFRVEVEGRDYEARHIAYTEARNEARSRGLQFVAGLDAMID